jgi:hypothetical protein
MLKGKGPLVAAVSGRLSVFGALYPGWQTPHRKALSPTVQKGKTAKIKGFVSPRQE